MTTILRGATMTVQVKLITETCCNCGMLYAMTEAFQSEKIEARGSRDETFYCPAGHAQSYTGKTAAQKLREQLETERQARQRAEQRIAQRDDEVREQRDRAEHERRRANGYKGHATKMTKRIKAGTCPCCNRTFKQLAAHMANKHPTFTPIEIEEGAPA